MGSKSAKAARTAQNWKQQKFIRDLPNLVGQDVTLRGWVYQMRSSGKIHFLILRDGTGIVQCAISPTEVGEETHAALSDLGQETSVVVSGVVQEEGRAPGGYELVTRDLRVVSRSDGYPITPKEHGYPFLLDHRHLWLRSSRQQAIARIRAEVIRACRQFFDDNGFLLVDAPILTPAACEGTTTLFETDYFGDRAYLTQSGQLYNEAAAMAFGRVYCFGPTFRAEKSKTRRHLIEFWMVEPEMAYACLDDIMDVGEALVEYLVQSALEHRHSDLEVLERDVEPLRRVKAPFPRISYAEAVEILRKHGEDFEYGNDFGGGDETILAKEFDRPVYVHRFPVECKAFYMKPDPENPKVVLGADLLAPEGYGEIIGGGQRIDDLELLIQRIEEHGLPKEAFEWYLDLRRYGSVEHGGFGLGIERVVAWICNVPHLRETMPFPRLINRIYP